MLRLGVTVSDYSVTPAFVVVNDRRSLAISFANLPSAEKK